ncbi:Calcium-binding mitochondrial carrier [Podosphaera aphanis]|nr:Calcium-binding mitochondrial carrier [Podosphaera aphanis]
MDPPESPSARKARLDELWQNLDLLNNGELDIDGLKNGLTRINHPLRNADAFLKDIIKVMDKNGDEIIQYEEFRNFIENAEKRLLMLFQSIDRDNNGKLDKKEIKTASDKAGLDIPNSTLDQFFAKVDRNGDGLIDFAEWRDFLLFIPTNNQPGIKAVFSFYILSVTPNFEGDTAMNQGNMNGLGYGVSGAIAGVISRTVTAPLDRIKVYLIADISPKKGTLATLKDGAVSARSTKTIGQPFVNACRTLWKSGGIRSLFAGNGLNVLKVIPESGIKFGSFEATKRAFARLEGHNEPQNISVLSKFVSGGLAGGISQLLVYPIDTLKFRIQCETSEGGLHGNKLIIATAKKMYAQGAFRTAYRGLGTGLFGMFPYAAIDLGTFEYLKKAVTQRNARIQGCDECDAAPNSLTLGFIGAFSGTVGASTVYPINVIRTRYQAQGTVLHPHVYDGIWDVARQTIKNEGFKGLFKGITPNLIKVIPAVSITYMVYEYGKKVMHLQ